MHVEIDTKMFGYNVVFHSHCALYIKTYQNKRKFCELKNECVDRQLEEIEARRVFGENEIFIDRLKVSDVKYEKC